MASLQPHISSHGHLGKYHLKGKYNNSLYLLNNIFRVPWRRMPTTNRHTKWFRVQTKWNRCRKTMLHQSKGMSNIWSEFRWLDILFGILTQPSMSRLLWFIFHLDCSTKSLSYLFFFIKLFVLFYDIGILNQNPVWKDSLYAKCTFQVLSTYTSLIRNPLILLPILVHLLNKFLAI